MSVLSTITREKAVQCLARGLAPMEEFKKASTSNVGKKFRGQVKLTGMEHTVPVIGRGIRTAARFCAITVGIYKDKEAEFALDRTHDPLHSMQTRGVMIGDYIEFVQGFRNHLYYRVPALMHLPEATSVDIVIPREFVYQNPGEKLYVGTITQISEASPPKPCEITLRDETGATGTFAREHGYYYVEPHEGANVVVLTSSANKILSMKPYL